jgi:hypothetical protein
LKKGLITAPVLSLSVEGKSYALYVDAFKKGLRAVLMQDKNMNAYALQKLQKHKLNYRTRDLEYVVIVFALKKLRHYLYRATYEVLTDK